MHVGR